jgi:dephospho-CoA kinase
VPVWDADAAVHRLSEPGGAGSAAIPALVPDAVGEDGVDRVRLRQAVLDDDTLLARIEAAIHPLVAEDRARFLAATEAEIVVFDVPLLFENGTDAAMDLTVVVSVPEAVQRDRVMARPGMTAEKLALILSRQMPDAEKRRRADVVIDTSTLEGARQAVRVLMRDIRAGKHARNRSGHRDDGV